MKKLKNFEQHLNENETKITFHGEKSDLEAKMENNINFPPMSFIFNNIPRFTHLHRTKFIKNRIG